jgi:hypothetical protein
LQAESRSEWILRWEGVDFREEFTAKSQRALRDAKEERSFGFSEDGRIKRNAEAGRARRKTLRRVSESGGRRAEGGVSLRWSADL